MDHIRPNIVSLIHANVPLRPATIVKLFQVIAHHEPDVFFHNNYLR